MDGQTSVSTSLLLTSQRRQTLVRWWPQEAANAIRIALTALAAIWLAMWLELELPHWAGWTVISVTLSTRAASLQKSLWRAASTIVGVAVSIALVANTAQATLAFDIAAALWLGLLTAASSVEHGQRSYGFALMGYTVPIVALADVQHPDLVFSTGVDRCSTILLGIGCAYASNVLVAPDVPAVSRALADKLDAAAAACVAWIAAACRGAEPGPVPITQVAALDDAVIDAFTEQPSLRSGGRAVHLAAPRLRRVLAAGLLAARLPGKSKPHLWMLMGIDHGSAGGQTFDGQIARVRVVARLLRGGDRLGRRRVSLRPHLLLWNQYDWDGWHAVNNGLRTATTVSLVNAFWYVTGWIHGSGAATWASLLAVLLASHPDPKTEARAFLVGSALAVVVGLVVRYAVLTTTGNFWLLAAALLPVCMLAVVGRSDKRAVFGVGYGFVVLGIVDPTNVMSYDLAASLNQIVAELIGMGVAVVAFSALPPPVSAETKRLRARRRLVRSVRSAALDPAFILVPDRWLSRGLGRLDLIAEDAWAARTGEELLLIGLLLIALRRTDDRSGEEFGRLIWAILARLHSEDEAAGQAALEELASHMDLPPLQTERIRAIATLASMLDLTGWPSFRRRQT